MQKKPEAGALLTIEALDSNNAFLSPLFGVE